MRHLAWGGMARVYLARARGPGGFTRHVVLKTMPPERCDDESFVSMFLDEARLVATLYHQHIAQVFEVGRGDDGMFFLAMEYVHGETVRRVLDAANQQCVTLPLELGLSVVSAAAAGLHYAHERCDVDGSPLRIVHRDVSPSNLILGFDGSIKLIDFGIAKATVRTSRTEPGFIKGKAGYMAPEQARGRTVDRRSDVFALGVLAYELTTQTRAFHADSQFESMRRTIHADIEPPSHVVAGYPPALEDVIMSALEVDPDDRFQDAAAMQRALEQVARELGLALGAAPVIDALGALFRARPEPWLPDAEPPNDDEPAPVHTDSAPLIMITKRTPTPPRLARGTARRDSQPTLGAKPIVAPVPQPIVAPVPQPIGAPEPQPIDPLDLTTQPFERELPAVPDLTSASAPTAPIVPRRRAVSATRPLARRRPGASPPPPPRQRQPTLLYGQAAVPAVGREEIPIVIAPPTLLAPAPATPPPSVTGAAAEPDAVPPSAIPLAIHAPRLETAAAPPSPSPVSTSAPYSHITTHKLAAVGVRRWTAFAIAGVAIAAGVIGIVFVASDATPTTPAASRQPRAPAPPPPPASVLAPSAPNPAPSAPSPAPSAPSPAPNPAPSAPSPAPSAPSPAPSAPTVAPAPAPDTVLLHVTTEPVGATVVLDGVRLGTTPYLAPVRKKSGQAWLKVRMRNHVAVKTRVSLEHDVRWDVQLRLLAAYRDRLE